MDHGHCLWLVLLLLVVICTMLLNVLEQALNIRQEDVQELTEELLSEHGLRSRSISKANKSGMQDHSVPSSMEDG